MGLTPFRSHPFEQRVPLLPHWNCLVASDHPHRNCNNFLSPVSYRNQGSVVSLAHSQHPPHPSQTHISIPPRSRSTDPSHFSFTSGLSGHLLTARVVNCTSNQAPASSPLLSIVVSLPVPHVVLRPLNLALRVVTCRRSRQASQ